MKKKKAVKTRNGRVIRIAKAFAKSWEDAFEIATYGKMRSDVEKTVHLYLGFKGMAEQYNDLSKESYLKKMAELGLEPDYKELVGNTAHHCREELCNLFLNAVNNGDVATVFAIGGASKSFRPDAANNPDERVRTEVLRLIAMRRRDYKWKDVARIICPRHEGENDRQYSGRLSDYRKTICRAFLEFGYTGQKPGHADNVDK